MGCPNDDWMPDWITAALSLELGIAGRGRLLASRKWAQDQLMIPVVVADSLGDSSRRGSELGDDPTGARAVE